MEAVVSSLFTCFAGFITTLRIIVAETSVSRPNQPAILPTALGNRLNVYLARVRTRLSALLDRIEKERAAGKSRRIAKPRPKPETPPEPSEKPPRALPDPLAMPRYFGWATGNNWRACGQLNDLRKLLCDPEMEALIRSDSRVGRILRPLCHRLGIDLNLIYRMIPPQPGDAPSADPALSGRAGKRHPLLPPQQPGTELRPPRPRRPCAARPPLVPPPPPQRPLSLDETRSVIDRLLGRTSGRNFEPPDFLYVHPK